MLKSDLVDLWDPVEMRKILYRSIIRDCDAERVDISSLKEELKLIPRHREAQYQPEFWFLDDDILLKLGEDEREVESAYDELQTEHANIVERMSNLRNAIKQKHRSLLSFGVVGREILENERLPKTTTVNSEAEVANAKLRIRNLITDITNLSLSCSQAEAKCAFMDKKIDDLSEKVKTQEEKDKSQEEDLVSARLEATEIQNTILNDLLGLITGKMKTIDAQMTQLKERRYLQLVELCKRTQKAKIHMLKLLFPPQPDVALQERKIFKTDLSRETSRELHVSKFDVNKLTRIRLTFMRIELKELIEISGKLDAVREKMKKDFY